MGVATNATVTKMLTLLCVFTMPLGCTMATYSYLEKRTSIINPTYPAIFVFVMAAFVTSTCMNVFECVVTTIFVCCFRDAELYKGRFMSSSLRIAFGIRKCDQSISDAGSPESEESAT